MFNFAYGPIGIPGITPDFLESLKNFDFSKYREPAIMAPSPEVISGIIPDPNSVAIGGVRPDRNPDGSPMVGYPEATDILEPSMPMLPGIGRPPFLPPPAYGEIYEPGGGRPVGESGIEALIPAEEEGYKKYIASDTNPFESMGVSSLGQDALRQMIFERNNPQVNQERNYKSYIG